MMEIMKTAHAMETVKASPAEKAETTRDRRERSSRRMPAKKSAKAKK